MMAIDESGLQTPDRARAQRVSLSKWVNEKFPSFQELLTAHDVARLTRRHRWVLAALTVVGRFPPRQRFHGRSVGWRRHDVERWLAERFTKEPQDEVQLPLAGMRCPPGRNHAHCAVAATNSRRAGCRGSPKTVMAASRQEVARP